ncbi:MAG: carbon-nitrogen hydrolase family protein [Pikeienuella sp.]
MLTSLIQLNSSDDPAENLLEAEAFVRQAAANGAQFVVTPEVTNVVSMNRDHQRAVLRPEGSDATLARLQFVAEELGIWVLIGSLALKSDDHAGRFVNRSFMIDSSGQIAARYDKIHMFDAAPSGGETYFESSGYRPGERMSLISMPFASVGMTICYDMRFPELFLRLARAGAQIITVPSAFTRPTGAAHWEVLLRARAIETGCFILAPAQCGNHRAGVGAERQTWGHSLAISPWGEVLADGGEGPGVSMVNLDMNAVADARLRVPSLLGARVFSG